MSGPRCEVPPQSLDAIIRLTEAIRKDTKIRSDLFPVLEFLEFAMPRIFPGFALEVGAKEEMGPNHGLTIPSENVIRLREDVYDGLCRGGGRDRFTAAHELGHYIMHRNVSIVFHRAENGRLPPYRDSEWQANSFAGALLMPERAMRECGSLAEIAQRFGVSLAAAEVQNRQLSRRGMRALN
ncbi:TPA: ImmA/IrrE family metallo-endopeptidase [Pseudomonas aeruginosa]